MLSLKSSITTVVLACLALSLGMLPAMDVESATMTDYCMTPPFIVGGVQPNLLLMIDNSASMYDPAYFAGSYSTGTTFSCSGGGAATTTESYCMDDTYNNSKICSTTTGTTCITDANCPSGETCVDQYAGYFDQVKVYKYREASPVNNSTTPEANDYFSELTSAESMPAGCAFGGSASAYPYFCLNFTGSNQVQDFYATGKFLNWLSASKFDVEKRILTGGKYDPASGILTSETRGCVGRRFVKLIKSGTGYLGITFALRGPNALEPDYVNPATQGGITRVEIYNTVNPNLDDCQCAVANWTSSSGSFGQAQTNTKDCLNLGTTGASGNELATFNHSLQTCWLIKDNIKKGATTEATLFQGVNTNDIETACLNAYKDACGGNVYSIAGVDFCPGTDGIQGTADDFNVSLVPTKFTNDISGNWICTKMGIHLAPPAPYNAMDATDLIPGQGYAGQCGSFSKGPGNKLDWQTSGSGNQECIKREILHYCFGAEGAEVIDPSTGTSSTSSTGNIPSVLMDSSVRSLGTPAGTVYARILTSSEPSGLIQEFAGKIRLGTMKFYDNSGSNNGSNTECNPGSTLSGIASNITCTGVCSNNAAKICSTNSQCSAGGTCNIAPKTDGAKIDSYIGDAAGGHGVANSIINKIDNMAASSWTPFAEGFYNAIGYMARSNAYTASPPMSRGADLRIQAGDYDNDRNPSQYRCQGNNILLITDGSSTADLQSNSNNLASLYADGDAQVGYDFTNLCPDYAGSRNIDNLAWLAKNRNIKTFSKTSASTITPAQKSEYIDTYVVYSGPKNSVYPATSQCNPVTLMDATASKGGTGTAYKPNNPTELEKDLKNIFTNIAAKSASGTAASVLASGEGSGANLIQAIFYPQKTLYGTDLSWTGVLHNLWYYIDPRLKNSSIREDTVQDRTLKIKSDYLTRYYYNTTLNETLANLCADANGDGVSDSVCSSTTTTHCCANSDCPTGETCNVASTVALDNLKYLWEAGRNLLQRTAASRDIFTNLNDDKTLDLFTTGNAGLIQPFLNADAANAPKVISYVRGIDDLDGNGTVTNDTIEANPVRSRTVTFSGTPFTWKLGDIINSTPKIVSWAPLNRYDMDYSDNTYKSFYSSDDYKKRGMVFAGANDGMLHAFKLGQLGVYNEADRKAVLGKVCSITTTQTCTTTADCPAGESCLDDTRDLNADADPDEIGKEVWAFIPKHALPYLKYLARQDYCHLYYVDATPLILDASIGIDTDINDDSTPDQDPIACNNTLYPNYWECKKSKDSWRTVLIGSARFGGACREPGANCTECVEAPLSGVGYSTYFALDITNPASPSLLWEYADKDLGLSTTGASVVRIGDKNKNGRWFVIIGSGPTGYVSPGQTPQMLGISSYYDSNGNNPFNPVSAPKIVVLDLKTGTVSGVPPAKITLPTASPYVGFVGSLTNSSIDLDFDYQDDAVYFGYTRANWSLSGGGVISTYSLSLLSATGTTIQYAPNTTLSSTNNAYKGKFIEIYSSTGRWIIRMIAAYDGTNKIITLDKAIPAGFTVTNTDFIFDGWNRGGVFRLLTKESIDPNQWVVSKVIETMGPVTAAVSKLQNVKTHKLRIYFGTGRYFYRVNDIIDDATTSRKFYGVIDPCFTGSDATSLTNFFNCSTTVAENNLGNASTSAGSSDADGWYIQLDGATAAYSAERMVTDPLASTIGVIFFTTTKPTADICSFGGSSAIWAVRYDTGGALDSGILKGKAMIQLSTGSIEEVDLKTSFTEREGRRTPALDGVAPLEQALQIPTAPTPIKKMMHMQKR